MSKIPQVLADRAQSFTDAEKAQARANIDVYSKAEVDEKSGSSDVKYGWHSEQRTVNVEAGAKQVSINPITMNVESINNGWVDLYIIVGLDEELSSKEAHLTTSITFDDDVENGLQDTNFSFSHSQYWSPYLSTTLQLKIPVGYYGIKSVSGRIDFNSALSGNKPVKLDITYSYIGTQNG